MAAERVPVDGVIVRPIGAVTTGGDVAVAGYSFVPAGTGSRGTTFALRPRGGAFGPA